MGSTRMALTACIAGAAVCGLMAILRGGRWNWTVIKWKSEPAAGSIINVCFWMGWFTEIIYVAWNVAVSLGNYSGDSI
jgi:hypothetical protein